MRVCRSLAIVLVLLVSETGEGRKTSERDSREKTKGRGREGKGERGMEKRGKGEGREGKEKRDERGNREGEGNGGEQGSE